MHVGALNYIYKQMPYHLVTCLMNTLGLQSNHNIGLATEFSNHNIQLRT